MFRTFVQTKVFSAGFWTATDGKPLPFKVSVRRDSGSCVRNQALRGRNAEEATGAYHAAG